MNHSLLYGTAKTTDTESKNYGIISPGKGRKRPGIRRNKERKANCTKGKSEIVCPEQTQRAIKK
jgi:hypothetical protein